MKLGLVPAILPLAPVAVAARAVRHLQHEDSHAHEEPREAPIPRLAPMPVANVANSEAPGRGVRCFLLERRYTGRA